MEDSAISSAQLVLLPPAFGVSTNTSSGLAFYCSGMEDSAISWLMILPPRGES